MDEIDPENKPLHTRANNPNYDEDGEQIQMENLNPYDSSSRRGSVNPTYDETSFSIKSSGELSEAEKIYLEKEKKVDAAWEKIKERFSKAKKADSSFTADLDIAGNVELKLGRGNAKPHPLFKLNGELNDKLPKTIIDSLGPPAEDIIETNDEKIAKSNKKINELNEQLATTSDENQK